MFEIRAGHSEDMSIEQMNCTIGDKSFLLDRADLDVDMKLKYDNFCGMFCSEILSTIKDTPNDLVVARYGGAAVPVSVSDYDYNAVTDTQRSYIDDFYNMVESFINS
jgi:hypothetical protein